MRLLHGIEAGVQERCDHFGASAALRQIQLSAHPGGSDASAFPVIRGEFVELIAKPLNGFNGEIAICDVLLCELSQVEVA